MSAADSDRHLLVAQLLRHHQVAAEGDVFAAVSRSQPHVLGTDAHRDGAAGMGAQSGEAPLRQLDGDALG